MDAPNDVLPGAGSLGGVGSTGGSGSVSSASGAMDDATEDVRVLMALSS
jgi:FAD/FMN-containing dehydrogenase